jgi:hypothetical protein
MFFVASSISLTPLSSAVLSAALSPTWGEPFEKFRVLPSWMGTGLGRSSLRCEAYAQMTAAVAAAAMRTEVVRRAVTPRTVGHPGLLRNITHG